MGELYLHNLSHYIEKYKCDQFVETGTGKGTGLEYACRFNFKKLYSIEYMQELFNICVNKFSKDDRVVLLNDNSLNGLKQIIHLLDETPTLFWLDAHFPGADFGFNDYDHLKHQENVYMPLIDELNLIRSLRPKAKDIFIIDDLQLYEKGPFQLYNPDFVLKYGNKDISNTLEIFKNSHTVFRDYRHQGFLILVPNE